MPTIQYPNHPNTDTAFVVQDDGTKNRALMTAPQDTSTLELPKNANSCKGYVTINGKKQRVVMTADVMGGGGGGGLPSQTGQSGKFLTTDGTDASWSDKPLVNNATGNNSLSILGNAMSSARGTAVGKDSSVSEIGGTSYGYLAKAQGISAVALGAYAVASGLNSIQLGSTGAITTNSDANTFKVGNVNGNFEIMSADGTVPTARLTKVNTTITLTAAGWSNGSQTVSVSGITSTGVVFVSPDPTDQADYVAAGILCTSQATDSLIFTCDTTPSSDIDVVVVQM
jgi:hypothetical protein